MKISRCKLKKEHSKKTSSVFCNRRYPRSSADLLGIHPNSAALLFYRKIREVIGCYLSLGSWRCFWWCRRIFGGHRKGKRGRGAAGKVAVSGILKRGGNGSRERQKRNAAACYFKENHAGQHRLHRLPGQLRCIGCKRFYPLPHQPRQTVCRQAKPHQRHRKLLESGWTYFEKIQRDWPEIFPAVLERMRISI